MASSDPHTHSDVQLPALAVSAGLELEQLDREHPPHFAEVGTFSFRDAFPVTQVTSDVLVYARSTATQEPSYVGVLRQSRVEPWKSQLRFARYEHFVRPVAVAATDGSQGIQAFAEGGYQLVPREELARVLTLVGKLPHSRQAAWDFAQALRDYLLRSEQVAERARLALRESANLAHVFHRSVAAELVSFLQGRGLDPKRYRLDTQGLIQDGTTRARYSVLGSYAQPHMAVMEPFRCAIDFVGQRAPSGGGEARAAALAALGHVTSGQYDAAVVGFVLREGYPGKSLDALSLDYAGTRNFLEHLESQRVLMSLIDTRDPR